MASTPLPTDEGESDHVAGPPTGMRPIEVEELAVQELAGAAESPPEVAAPAAPNEEDSDHASSTVVRLSDAERIASERLDGAAEGSLKEALAIAPVAWPAASSLLERIELAGESPTAESVASAFEPTSDLEASDAAAVVAEAPEPSAQAAAWSSDPIGPEESVAAPIPPAVEDAASEATADAPPVPAGDATRDVVAAPARDAEAPDNVRPLASALDAAAKLAADANAAAEALENLKRLLERQLPNVAAGPPPVALAEVAQLQPTVQMPATVAVAPPPSPQPPTLPLHAVRDASGRTTLRPAMLAPLPPRPVRPERMRLDVRGFLAGFALSWAVGVVLYLFMTAG